MLNLGVGEMVLIMVVAMIVFGPNRLPEIARSVGKFIRNFQQETNRAISDLREGIDSPTAGVFDSPDEDVTATVEQIPPEPSQQFTPAEELAAAAAATKPVRRKPSKATGTKPRSASPAGKGSAPKKRAGVPRAKKPASKRAATPRRSPKAS